MKMKIDVNSIRYDVGGIKHVDEQVQMADLKMKHRTVELPEPLHLDLTITNAGENYLVTGEMEARTVMECNRCLEKFVYPMKVEFFQEFEKNDLKDENFIDLTDSIYEHLILELPIKTLCDENCKGLCPQCGQNINSKDCGCDRQVIDPRLVKLQDLFKKD